MSNNNDTTSITALSSIIKKSSGINTDNNIITDELLQQLSECVIYVCLLSKNTRSILQFLFEQNKLNDDYIELLDTCLFKHNISVFCNAIINPPKEFCTHNTYDSIDSVNSANNNHDTNT